MNIFEHYSNEAIEVMEFAMEEAIRLKRDSVTPEDIFLGLLHLNTGHAPKALKSMGVKLRSARANIKSRINHRTDVSVPKGRKILLLNTRARKVVQLSYEESRSLGNQYIATEHLLLALIKESQNAKSQGTMQVLKHFNVNLADLKSRLIRSFGDPKKRRRRSLFFHILYICLLPPSLYEFGTNVSYQALIGELDPVIGRDKEVEQIIQILGCRTKNNPLLIGEAGVGKTALAESLALRIQSGDVPSNLKNKRVITLDVGALIGDTKHRGAFEGRLTTIMREVQKEKDIILFIDEIHTIVGAGSMQGALDAGNILKPALSRGEFQCIGATTVDEYRKYIQKDAALDRRFQLVAINEPSVDKTIKILYGLRKRYETYHNIIISEKAIIAAAKLADQYISDRFLPDKAIDLIDRAASRIKKIGFKFPRTPINVLREELRQVVMKKDIAVRNQLFKRANNLLDTEIKLVGKIDTLAKKLGGTSIIQTPTVNEEDIAQVVGNLTGIPVSSLTKSESERLLQMGKTLHNRVIGQDEAVVAVCKAVKRARAGLKDPNRPIASFLFTGPTGVGKTELTKALATCLFNSEKAMVRLDMSEYSESHTVSKLIGASPGLLGFGEGGQLTEAVRRNPYTIVLFDELEKAHPDIFNLFLQIFEDGRLTDANGRTVDFKHTLLIMTSNIGSSKVVNTNDNESGLGDELDQTISSDDRVKTSVNEELKEYFRPEFLNRLDEIIIFKPLTLHQVTQIAEIMLAGLSKRLSTKKIQLEVTHRFKARLIRDGYDPTYGARPLRRAITRLLENNLAEHIISKNLKTGDVVTADIGSDGKVKFLVEGKLLDPIQQD